MTKACFYGVGVGPGDAELITLKAVRTIQQADVLAYLVNKEGHSCSRSIVAPHLRAKTTFHEELPLLIPMKVDRMDANTIYDLAAENILIHLSKGKNVVFLCEGDPLFYGSFAYLLQRLTPYYCCVTIPGISSIHAASAQLQVPLVQLTQSLLVINARQSDQQILSALSQHDSVVILKIGSARERIIRLINHCGRSHDAKYIEHATSNREAVAHDINALPSTAGPYFSLFLVTRSITK